MGCHGVLLAILVIKYGRQLGNAWEIPELMEVYSPASHVTDYPMVKSSYLSNIATALDILQFQIFAGPSPQICKYPCNCRLPLLSQHLYMAMESIPMKIPFLGEWTFHKSQLFWCELQGYKVLTHCHISNQQLTHPCPRWLARRVRWTSSAGAVNCCVACPSPTEPLTVEIRCQNHATGHGFTLFISCVGFLIVVQWSWWFGFMMVLWCFDNYCRVSDDGWMTISHLVFKDGDTN